MATVVVGEASETESEDDSLPEDKDLKNKSPQHAKEEISLDPENVSVDNSVTVSTPDSLYQLTNSTNETKFTSLMHQKLRESNIKLYNDLENFINNMTDDALKNINHIDQQLLRSQVTLQGAVTSLKNLSVNSLHIKNKLHSILSDNFLSNIRVVGK